MLLTISIVFILLLLLLGLLFIGLLANRRSQAMAQLSTRHKSLNWYYRPYANLSPRIKAAHFQILELSENRLFRHLIEGHWPLPATGPELFDQASEEVPLTAFNLLDCTLINKYKTSTQTLVLMPIATDRLQGFQCSISPENTVHGHSGPDPFSDHRSESLLPLAAHQTPDQLAERSIHSNHPGRCAALLRQMTLKHWLLTYPHLHIEIANDMLLVYKQNSIIEAEETESVLTLVAELNRILCQQ